MLISTCQIVQYAFIVIFHVSTGLKSWIKHWIILPRCGELNQVSREWIQKHVCTDCIQIFASKYMFSEVYCVSTGMETESGDREMEPNLQVCSICRLLCMSSLTILILAHFQSSVSKLPFSSWVWYPLLYQDQVTRTMWHQWLSIRCK